MVVDSNPPIPEMPGLAGRHIELAQAEKIVSAPLRELFAWWQSHAAAGPVRRCDFDITEHRAIAAHLFIIEPISVGYQLALAGEEYLRLVGTKKGMRYLAEDPDPTARDFKTYLDLVARIGKPFRSIGRLELTVRSWIRFEALLCPLYTAAGEPGGFIGAAAAHSG
ncbi:MAG: PAS domain-containing protein [Rhodospirillaceae bacterium]|nr:PAS domain-containing protein [Rhodospirillaceae bacterium]